jgi:hypothetical protein
MFFNDFVWTAKGAIELDPGFTVSDPQAQTVSMTTDAVKHLTGYLLAVEHKHAGEFPDKNLFILVQNYHPQSRHEKPFVGKVTGLHRTVPRQDEATKRHVQVQQIELQLVTVDKKGQPALSDPRWFDWSTLNWSRLCMTWDSFDAKPAAGVPQGKGRKDSK